MPVAAYLFQAHLPANVRDEATRLVDIVVAAVEQTLPGATGPEKKAAAVAVLRAIARDLHLNVPAALFDVLIEATVAAREPLPDAVHVGFEPRVVSWPACYTGPGKPDSSRGSASFPSHDFRNSVSLNRSSTAWRSSSRLCATCRRATS